MADKLGRAVLEITVDDKQYKFAMDEVAKQTKRTTDEIRGISQNLDFGLLKDFAGSAVTAVRALAEGIVELGTRGAMVADVAGAFDQLTGRVGETSATMLGALRSAVGGTISDLELMRTTNKALGAGLNLSAGDMATVAAGAKMLADRTGKDTKEAFDALTKAMVTGRTKGLAEFGFSAKDGAAILGTLKGQLEAAGPATLDFADMVDAAKAQIANFTDSLALATAQSPVLQAGMAAAGTAMTQAFGANTTSLVGFLVSAIGELAIFLGRTAQVGIEAARFIVVGFTEVKAILNGALATISGAIGSVAGLFATMYEKAAGLPGVGALFAGMAKELRATADTAKSLAFGFQELTNEGMRNVDAQNAAFDKTRAVVDATVAAMIAARGQGALNTAQAVTDSNTVATTTETNNLRVVTSEQQKATLLASLRLAEQTALTTLGQFAAQQTATLYAGMTSTITSFYAQTMAQASAAGFQTRGELEATAAKAEETYQRMLKSGLYTEQTLAAARAASTDAKLKLDDTEEKGSDNKYQMIMAAASTALRSIFGKSKAAAIAAATIDTAAAVVSSFKNGGGYPWGLIPAAAMLAAGMKQIATIKSQKEGFARGTPGLDFMGFGRAMPTYLHGQEAVIPRGKGHILAGEVAAALPGAGGDMSAERLDRIAESLDRLPYTMTRAWKTAMALA